MSKDFGVAAVAAPIVDGDIFRWSYKNEKPADVGAYKRYHCKSQIAIARNGFLQDTYWNGSSDVHWSYADAERDLKLTLMGNLNDLEKRPEYHAVYYEDADCVDLNHPNSSRDNFYVRKDAVRSQGKMRSVLVERIAATEREISFAQSKLERQRATLFELDAGKALEDIYL